MKRKKPHGKYGIILFVLFVALIAAVLSALLGNMPEEIIIKDFPQQPAYHVHADFLVFINRKESDFANPEYDVADPLIHLHLGNYKGDKVMHIESREVDLGDFFASLGMIFNKTCFIAEEEHCSDETHSLKFYVNGAANMEYDRYRPKDLDRILISYGNETDLSRQMGAVTSLACVFSQKCVVPPEAENKIVYN